MSSIRRPVAVVVGATSKWQADGRNTQLAHGRVLDDSDLPVGIRWGVGGAIAILGGAFIVRSLIVPTGPTAPTPPNDDRI